MARKTEDEGASPRSPGGDHSVGMSAAEVRLLVSQLDREERDAKALFDAVYAERVAQLEEQL